MPKYLPPPHKFGPKTLDSTDTVDFTHLRRTVNRYCVNWTSSFCKLLYHVQVVPRPLNNDPRLFQCIYRYSHASKRFVEVYMKLITHNASIATKVVCLSRLLKCLRSFYGKHCGPRSDCSYRNSLFWLGPPCLLLYFIRQ